MGPAILSVMVDRSASASSDTELSLRAMVARELRKPVPPLDFISARPSVEELVRIIGPEATVLLCDKFGGLTRSIGRVPAPDIVAAIGKDAAVKLRAAWGTGRLYVPRRATSAADRHKRVRALAKAGSTRQQIALDVGLSERQVYSILSKA